ncbi:MAG TPA: protein kinase [Polyangiaceae bacterium]|nr:protein kinase [Polyangiaceae bacterium]
MAQDPARPNAPPAAGASPSATGSVSNPNGPASTQTGTYFLGRYRVVDEIGIGGMASVHLARMDGPGGFQKWIAIKRIHPHLVEDESFIQMFLDEARVAARISHPNVATVFELGKQDDSFWIAMEYLHGEPLREIMRRCDELRTTMPAEIACRVIADAAEGLHAAHELLGKNGEKLNLVHRDVTPHNLFVTYDGATKVVDFGIAKFSSRMASTRAGTLKGKLAYMSPEQVAGEPLDRRTDIFALGVVLWELTTGQRLFRMDSDLDTLAKVQECNVPRPTSLIKGYPIELERIVLKALAKNKNERYRTAREFSRALQSMLMKRGLFIASDEVSSFVRSIFSDRIEKREAHLRWAAEVTQTINVEDVKAPVPEFDGSLHTYNSDVRAGTSRAGGPPRPSAGGPPRPSAGGGAPLPSPQQAAPLEDLSSMEDDGPTIMAPTATDEDFDDDSDNDATVVSAVPTPRASAPEAPRAPAPRPAAGGRAPEDAPQALPNMSIAHGPRPAPAPVRVADAMAPLPPVVVEARPAANPQQFGPAAFAPTYAPGDPQLQPAGGYVPPYNQQQPTQLLPRQRAGLPMWVVGVASGLAALVILAVVYVIVMPPSKTATGVPSAPVPIATGAAPTVGTGPFGAARGAFAAVLKPGAASSTTAPTANPTATATATQPAPTASVTATPPATATQAAPTATATATHVPTPVAVTPANDKGYLRLITVPPCEQWYDNGTAMGSCPIVNKPLPVGTHRITLSTSTPKVSKTISVIIMSGQVANPPLVILSP